MQTRQQDASEEDVVKEDLDEKKATCGEADLSGTVSCEVEKICIDATLPKKAHVALNVVRAISHEKS